MEESIYIQAMQVYLSYRNKQIDLLRNKEIREYMVKKFSANNRFNLTPRPVMVCAQKLMHKPRQARVAG